MKILIYLFLAHLVSFVFSYTQFTLQNSKNILSSLLIHKVLIHLLCKEADLWNEFLIIFSTIVEQCSSEITGVSISDETLEIMLLVSDLMVLICQKMKNQSKIKEKR